LKQDLDTAHNGPDIETYVRTAMERLYEVRKNLTENERRQIMDMIRRLSFEAV